MINLREIQAPSEKSTICNSILRELPNWFGIEESIVDYNNESKQMPFFAACDDEKIIGFIAIKKHNIYTLEVYVMGILQEYHRKGIGRMLIECCEQYCLKNSIEFLTVKTLDVSRPSKSYERTRHFYHAVGFRPLEVFPLLWDENNPCLFMVKYVGCTK